MKGVGGSVAVLVVDDIKRSAGFNEQTQAERGRVCILQPSE
jgi:hypothetical protein